MAAALLVFLRTKNDQMGTCRFETAKTNVFERSKGPKSQKKVIFGTSFALGNVGAAVELSTCRHLLHTLSFLIGFLWPPWSRWPGLRLRRRNETEVVNSLTRRHFLQNGHFCNFWSKKSCKNDSELHYFSTWCNLVTFGPKSDRISQAIPVSNRLCQK